MTLAAPLSSWFQVVLRQTPLSTGLRLHVRQTPSFCHGRGSLANSCSCARFPMGVTAIVFALLMTTVVPQLLR
jgi:hypothetical protein